MVQFANTSTNYSRRTCSFNKFDLNSISVSFRFCNSSNVGGLYKLVLDAMCTAIFGGVAWSTLADDSSLSRSRAVSPPGSAGGGWDCLLIAGSLNCSKRILPLPCNISIITGEDVSENFLFLTFGITTAPSVAHATAILNNATYKPRGKIFFLFYRDISSSRAVSSIMKLYFLVALAALAVLASADDSDVLEFNEDNFDAEVAKHDIILVEFFAPWYVF